MPSAPTAIAQLVVTALRGVGKAAAASGRQMVKNFQYKPEGVETTSARTSSSGGKQNARVTEQMNMSIEEAQMILNVKKEDSMENIQKSYERIFAANGPPPPPTAAPGQPAPPPSRKLRTPSHSHYLQSKVFRALERIKAERGDEAPPTMNGDAAAAPAPPPPPSGPSNPGSSS